MIIFNFFVEARLVLLVEYCLKGYILMSLKNILFKKIRETAFMAVSRPKELSSEYRYSKMV